MPSLRRTLPLALLCTAVLGVLPVPHAPTADAQTPPDADAPVTSDWVTWVDPDHGFALLLPPSHRLARSGTQWYAHGMLDGEPLVPDVSIAFVRERSAAETLKESFPADATSEELEMGPGTVGLRVIASYETPGGEPYEEDAYLVEAPDGTFLIHRYESFDWPPFTSVARSFRLVREVDDRLP